MVGLEKFSLPGETRNGCGVASSRLPALLAAQVQSRPGGQKSNLPRVTAADLSHCSRESDLGRTAHSW
jgi:hypothetical protein